MSYQPPKSEPVQQWPIILGIVCGLICLVLGSVWSMMIPNQLVWNEQDAKDYQEIAMEFHAATHQATSARSNSAPTASEAEAKQRFLHEKFAQQKEKQESALAWKTKPKFWFWGLGSVILFLTVIWHIVRLQAVTR